MNIRFLRMKLSCRLWRIALAFALAICLVVLLSHNAISRDAEKIFFRIALRNTEIQLVSDYKTTTKEIEQAKCRLSALEARLAQIQELLNKVRSRLRQTET